jgi:hypothetical protein
LDQQVILMAQVSAERENYQIKVEITLVSLCKKCGAVVGSRNSQMSVTCKTCDHKNPLDSEDNVLLRTSSLLELQEVIQLDKIQRLAYNKAKTY